MLPFRIALVMSGVGTLAELARRSGIERTRLGRCLAGELRWRAGERERIAAVLGWTVAELFPGPITNQSVSDRCQSAVAS